MPNRKHIVFSGYISRLPRDYEDAIQESFNAPSEARTLNVPFNRPVPISDRTYTSGVVSFVNQLSGNYDNINA